MSDSSGALIPGVEVAARNIATGIATSRITNEAGNYDFASLQPGTYTISANLSGFQIATYNNVQLSQGQQVRLNFTLQVGTVTQAVEVVAEANTLLATTSSSGPKSGGGKNVRVSRATTSSRAAKTRCAVSASTASTFFGCIATTSKRSPTSFWARSTRS